MYPEVLSWAKGKQFLKIVARYSNYPEVNLRAQLREKLIESPPRQLSNYGKPLTIITSLFLHNSDTHLIENMIGLFIIGFVVLNQFGVKKGCVFLFFTGIVGHIMQLLLIPPINFFLAIIDLLKYGILTVPWLPVNEVGISGAMMGWMAQKEKEL